MDRDLRKLQRKAEATQSLESAWAYIKALEQALFGTNTKKLEIVQGWGGAFDNNIYDFNLWSNLRSCHYCKGSGSGCLGEKYCSWCSGLGYLIFRNSRARYCECYEYEGQNVRCPVHGVGPSSLRDILLAKFKDNLKMIQKRLAELEVEPIDENKLLENCFKCG